MNEHTVHPSSATPAGLDYRVAHLTERFAAGLPGELGVRAELRGEAVLLTGTFPSARCREDIMCIAREAFPDVPLHCDTVTAGTARSSAVVCRRRRSMPRASTSPSTDTLIPAPSTG